MTTSVDPDLDGLLQDLGSRVVDMTALRGSGYEGYQPTAWRVRMADGRSVKARVFGSVQRAAAVVEVLGRVGHEAFPRALARRERAVLTEWVPGRPCAGRVFSLDEIREIGGVLGRLHALPAPDDKPWIRRLDVPGWRKHLALDLDRLCNAGLLTLRDRDDADGITRATAPTGCNTTFVHRDFCPDNLVERDTGGFACIDNETAGIDTREFDLGRVWWRWPMSSAERSVFLDGYEVFSETDDFRDHQAFWLLVALADASVFRLTKSREAARAPIEVLRRLLGERDRFDA